MVNQMNERFKELYQQAVEYANRKVVFIENPDLTISVQDVIDKKFAELIVRECAQQLRMTDYNELDCSINTAMEVAADDLEEHFGVKK